MFGEDSADITFSSGSRLLSESPPPPSSSRSLSQTGHGGDDLSLSELSVADRFTPRATNSSSQIADSIFDEDPFNDDTIGGTQDGVHDVDETPEDDEQTKKQAAKAREEKLQRDLFILRKLNSSFAAFNEVLKDTQTGTERVAEQLANTNALLDKYVNILGKSEKVTKLIFDERWDGAEQDEDIIYREHEEKKRREAEERALAAQRERERMEREEREAREREEKERIEQERIKKPTTRGTIRGVRGTRASMRGVKGASASSSRDVPPTSTSTIRGARPSGIPAAVRSTSSTAIGTGTTTTRGIPRR